MLIEQVVLDLDDVLNSLALPLLKRAGCGVNEFAYDRYPTECGFDIVAACNKLNPQREYTDQEFWNAVPGEFWSLVPKSMECNELISILLKRFGPKDILIATSPTLCESSHGYKVRWIKENLPASLHRRYAITPKKWWLAKPGRLLIDDRDLNCDRFTENGGTSFLFARPWNRAWGLSPMPAFKQFLENIDVG